MLTLKGNRGKSCVLEALMCTYKNNCIGIVYEDNSFGIPFGTYIIDTDECDMNEFCKELPNIVADFFKDNFGGMVVVYTNFKESEVYEIKEAVKKLENNNYCSIGIVMCKE